MKRTYALFALGSVLSGVESRFARWANNKRDADWRPAQATVAVDQLLHGMSPKPTNAPRAPDAAPDRSLQKRDPTDNTCAYISGITASSLYCDPDNACVYNSRVSAVGCCPDVSLNNTSSRSGTSIACPVWTTCFDMTDSSKYTTDNGFTMYCGQTSYPVCIKHLYQDRQLTGYSLWGCAKSSRTDFVFYTPTDLTSTSSTKRSSTSSTSTEDSSTSSTATTTADPGTSTSPVPVSGGKKSTPTGAIVGGVVGGVGALALIGLAAFFLLRRKKSNTAAAAAPTTDLAPAAQGPPSQGPNSGGYYDPKQPQMVQQQQQQPGGQYGYGAAGGFASVDPRASIAKPPYAVQQTEYNPNQSPNQFSPPGSPAPAYNGAPGATPPPGAAGAYQPHSPDSTGGYGQQQQPYQAGQYNQGGYPSPPQQAQPYGHQQPGGHPTHFAAELPTQRGDGEVRELAG